MKRFGLYRVQLEFTLTIVNRFVSISLINSGPELY